MKPAALLVLLLLPGLASAATLRDALDAACARAPALRGLVAGREEAAARRDGADRLFPAPPSLGLGQRNGQMGRSETELELATPLWLPGQRQASLALGEAALRDNGAAQAAQRWSIAGQLRAAIAAVQAARAERDLARVRLGDDRRLAEEVARRVAAGDLARTDLLQARNEALAAESALLAAESALTRSVRDYRLLTGLEALPTDADEAVATAPETHPALEGARSSADLARSGLALARRDTREAPELSVQYQRSRDVGDPDFRDSVRFGLRIPFSGDARNRPLVAAANTELVKAEVELERTRAEIDAERAATEDELAQVLQAVALAAARRQAATERLALIRKGFDLGELSLAQMLQARAQANEAEAAAVRAERLAAAARARLNQARGVLP